MISVCPRCGERVLVPSMDDEDDEIVDLPASDADDIASVSVECKLCNSRYYARPSQVGQMMICPDCHAENLVLEPAAPRPQHQPEPLSDDDDFKLSDPVDTPAYQALARDALEFERAIRSRDGFNAPPVPQVSPRPPSTQPSSVPPAQPTAPPKPAAVPAPMEDSGFELLEMDAPPATAPPASESDRGTDIPRSPSEPQIVEDFELVEMGPPSPTPATSQGSNVPPSATSAPADESFELLDTPPATENRGTDVPRSPTQSEIMVSETAAPANPNDIELFPEDRMPARPLHAPVVVQPAPQPGAIDDEDDELEVRVSAPVERVEHKPVTKLPQADKPEDKFDPADFDVGKLGEAVRKMLPQGPAPEVPPELAARRPFSTGIFSFLLQPAILVRWIFLAVLMMFELWAGGFVVGAITADASGALGAIAQIVGLLIYLAAFLPGFFAAAIICATSLTILEETANGRDTVEGFGEFLSFDWLGGAFYVAAAGFLSLLPAGFLVLLLSCVGVPAILTAIVLYPTAFVLFPPMLLSMLETDSVTVPLSKDMLRSFVPLLRFWTTFFLLVLALGFVGIVAVVAGYFLVPWVGIFSLAISAAVITAIPFLYFRLLGRMAMVYRDYVLATSPDEEEEDDEKDPGYVIR